MSQATKAYDRLHDQPTGGLNTDQAITRVGGMGCYQVISVLLTWMLYATIGNIIYGLSYFQDRDTISIYCTSP